MRLDLRGEHGQAGVGRVALEARALQRQLQAHRLGLGVALAFECAERQDQADDGARAGDQDESLHAAFVVDDRVEVAAGGQQVDGQRGQRRRDEHGDGLQHPRRDEALRPGQRRAARHQRDEADEQRAPEQHGELQLEDRIEDDRDDQRGHQRQPDRARRQRAQEQRPARTRRFLGLEAGRHDGKWRRHGVTITRRAAPAQGWRAAVRRTTEDEG